MVKLLKQFFMTIAGAVIKPSPFQPGIKNSDGLKWATVAVSPRSGEE